MMKPNYNNREQGFIISGFGGSTLLVFFPMHEGGSNLRINFVPKCSDQQQFLHVTRFCLRMTEQQGSFDDLFTHVKTKAIF
jgi:hypothetical protein